MGGRGRGKKMEVRRVGGRATVVFAGTDLHRYSLADQFHLGILSRVQKKKEKKERIPYPVSRSIELFLLLLSFSL